MLLHLSRLRLNERLRAVQRVSISFTIMLFTTILIVMFGGERYVEVQMYTTSSKKSCVMVLLNWRCTEIQ